MTSVVLWPVAGTGTRPLGCPVWFKTWKNWNCCGRDAPAAGTSGSLLFSIPGFAFTAPKKFAFFFLQFFSTFSLCCEWKKQGTRHVGMGRTLEVPPVQPPPFPPLATRTLCGEHFGVPRLWPPAQPLCHHPLGSLPAPGALPHVPEQAVARLQPRR